MKRLFLTVLTLALVVGLNCSGVGAMLRLTYAYGEPYANEHAVSFGYPTPAPYRNLLVRPAVLVVECKTITGRLRQLFPR